ncbi:MAG TPA: CAP domain-containing protein [Gaiellaceae bacterium]|nr:CAP domain-containing protein [Gaiellaceae bacterium]
MARRTAWTATTVAVSLALLAALLTPVATAHPGATHGPRAALTSLESGVLQRLNAIRVQHRLVPLELSAELTESAAAHTREMEQDGYFAHSSADGTVFWKRIQHWYAQGTYGFWSVGENLLWSAPDIGAPGALRLWMSSPEHRANILDPNWREIGVSAQHVASAPGAYKGLEVTVITTDFGVRR